MISAINTAIWIRAGRVVRAGIPHSMAGQAIGQRCILPFCHNLPGKEISDLHVLDALTGPDFPVPEKNESMDKKD